MSVNTVLSILFQEECALILPFTTPTAATPIVISCLLCDPLTSAAHGRRSPKRNMTLTRTASGIRLPKRQIQDTQVDLTGWNDKGNALYGARHGRIFQMPTLNAPDARSVSTTAVTPSAALTSCLPSTWRSGLSNGEERHSHRERRAEPEYPKGKPPYPGNPGADWKAQRMDWRTVQGAGKRPGAAPAIPGLANLLMKYLSVQREKSRKYSQSWQRQHAADELKTVAKAVGYLSEHGISTLAELDATLSSVSDQADAIRAGMKTPRSA